VRNRFSVTGQRIVVPALELLHRILTFAFGPDAEY